jgi:hypothetical protein
LTCDFNSVVNVEVESSDESLTKFQFELRRASLFKIGSPASSTSTSKVERIEFLGCIRHKRHKNQSPTPLILKFKMRSKQYLGKFVSAKPVHYYRQEGQEMPKGLASLKAHPGVQHARLLNICNNHLLLSLGYRYIHITSSIKDRSSTASPHHHLLLRTIFLLSSPSSCSLGNRNLS